MTEKEKQKIDSQYETNILSRGRGQGWEEKIQHRVFENWLIDDQKLISKATFWHEFPIKIQGLKQVGAKANVFVDFVIDRGDYYELIECKDWNHPVFNIAPALGQALVYRELIKKTGGYPGGKEKHIKLGLCFEHGFASQYGQWTTEHDVLLTELAKSIKEELRVYLVAPKESEFAAKEYWWDDKNFCMVQPVKIFK